MVGYGPDAAQIIPGQRALVASTSPAPTVTTAGDSAGQRFQRVRNSGGGSKQRFFQDRGPTPFHHIVDPTGAQAGWSIVLQDLVVPAFASGNAWLFFGLGSFNTATDETSLVGAWWHTDNVTAKWKSGVYDGTGSPSTTLHETTHDNLTFAALSDSHRLAIEIEAVTKTINFYANGVLEDTFTPASPLAQMTNCPHFYYYGITEAAADASLYTRGGGNPRILTLVPVD